VHQDQFGFPKVRSSVNTKVVVSPSSVSQRTENLAITSNSDKSRGMDTTCKLHPLNSNRSFSPPSRTKVMDLSRTKLPTVLLKTSIGQFPPPPHSTTITDFSVELCQLSTAFQKLSIDERMFVLHVYTWGIATARRIATACHYKLRVPIKKLIAMTNELGPRT